MKQTLLLLSGDVETNPGPLGQPTEGKAIVSKQIDANSMYCMLSGLPVHMYKIASLQIVSR